MLATRALLILVFVVGVLNFDEAAAVNTFKDEFAAEGRSSDIAELVRIMQIPNAVKISFAVSDRKFVLLCEDIIKIGKRSRNSTFQLGSYEAMKSELMVWWQR